MNNIEKHRPIAIIRAEVVEALKDHRVVREGMNSGWVFQGFNLDEEPNYKALLKNTGDYARRLIDELGSAVKARDVPQN